jgi:hypothetical protein
MVAESGSYENEEAIMAANERPTERYAPKTVTDLIKALAHVPANAELGMSSADHEGEIEDVQIEIIRSADGPTLVEFLYPGNVVAASPEAAPEIPEVTPRCPECRSTDLVRFANRKPFTVACTDCGRYFEVGDISRVGQFYSDEKVGLDRQQQLERLHLVGDRAQDNFISGDVPKTLNDEIKEEAQHAVEASHDQVAIAIDRFSERICTVLERIANNVLPVGKD